MALDVRRTSVGSTFHLECSEARSLVATSVKAGHLSKLGEAGVFGAFGAEGSWKARFFTMKMISLLMYFDKATDVSPAGAIAMNEDCTVEYLPEHHGRKHVLAVKPHPANPEARTYFLAADTQSEATEWQRTLLTARYHVMALKSQELEAENQELKLQLSTTQEQLTKMSEAVANASEHESHTIRDLQFDVDKLRTSSVNSITRLQAAQRELVAVTTHVNTVVNAKRRGSIASTAGAGSGAGAGASTAGASTAGAGAGAGAGSDEPASPEAESLLEQHVAKIAVGATEVKKAAEKLLKQHLALSTKYKSLKKMTKEWAERMKAEKTRRRSVRSFAEAAADAAVGEDATAAAVGGAVRAVLQAPPPPPPPTPAASDSTSSPSRAIAASSATAAPTAHTASGVGASVTAVDPPVPDPHSADVPKPTARREPGVEPVPRRRSTGNTAAIAAATAAAAVSFPAPRAPPSLPSPESMGNIFAKTHHPGRLHIKVMGARHLPASSFGMGTPHGYVHLSCFGQQRSGHVRELRVKPDCGLAVALEEQFTFVVNDHFTSSKALLQVDIVAQRKLVRDHLVVRGCAEVSRVEVDPSTPHAMWVKLREPVGRLGMDPDPKELLLPIVAAGGAAAGAGSRAGSDSGVPASPSAAHAAMSPGTAAMLSPRTAALLRGREATEPQLPDPPPGEVPAILIQASFSKLPVDPPVFFVPGLPLRRASVSSAEDHRSDGGSSDARPRTLSRQRSRSIGDPAEYHAELEHRKVKVLKKEYLKLRDAHTAEVASLTRQLEEARLRNGQLEEALKRLKAEHDVAGAVHAHSPGYFLTEF